jgi:hypothetical protein
LKTPYLLGFITALLFSSFALSGMYAQAGLDPNEIITVQGNIVTVSIFAPAASVATCPGTHQVIGGGFSDFAIQASTGVGGQQLDYDIISNLALNVNSYETIVFLNEDVDSFVFSVYAVCQKINFPINMGSMIGGELLDLDTMALFIGAIGVNPVITGLVAITMGGVTAQAIWYVYSRTKSENS